jgi:hypothetical protein
MKSEKIFRSQNPVGIIFWALVVGMAWASILLLSGIPIVPMKYFGFASVIIGIIEGLLLGKMLADIPGSPEHIKKGADLYTIGWSLGFYSLAGLLFLCVMERPGVCYIGYFWGIACLAVAIFCNKSKFTGEGTQNVQK